MKIQEIAALANVSTATVSRVFSHHPNVSREVRERVFAVARNYKYHPRLSGRYGRRRHAWRDHRK